MSTYGLVLVSGSWPTPAGAIPCVPWSPVCVSRDVGLEGAAYKLLGDTYSLY